MKLIIMGVAIFLELTGIKPILPSNLPQKIENRVAGIATPATLQLYQPPARQSLIQPRLTGTEKLNLAAKSILALDTTTGRVMYRHNDSTQRPIASITKLAAAILIVQNHNLDEIVTVKPLPSYHPEAVLLGIRPGQQFKVGELLKAALIASDNDALDALALHHSPTLPAFAAQMNRLMGKWEINDVYFANTNGLSDGNVASADAVGKLAKLAVGYPQIAELVRLNSATVTDLAGQTYLVESTNDLLPDGRFYGIKTGYTLAAGQSFVGLAEIKGHRIITVVLNSPDRFGETKTLADWIERNYSWD